MNLYQKWSLLLVLLSLAGWLPATIVIYGDTRSHPEVHAELIAQMVSYCPELAIHTGDLNSKGVSQDEYDRFFQIVKPLADICPLYAVKGNHEKSSALFLHNFPFLGEHGYASVVSQGLRFYLLDSTADLNPGSPQYSWLKEALQDSLPGIVILHHPLFSSGMHGGEELGLQMFLPQLFEQSNVIAVFSGHDHDYERSEYQGISYLVTGGGGSPQREERSPNPYSKVFTLDYHYIILNPGEGRVKVEVYNLQNQLVDGFSLPLRKSDK